MTKLKELAKTIWKKMIEELLENTQLSEYVS